MATFFVEQHAVPAALPELTDDLARVRAVAARLTVAGRPIRWVHATFVPVREACVSVVDAPDEPSLVSALTEAGVRASVYAAVTLTPRPISPPE